MIKIPNYKTIKKIGSGGMGDVYLAEHEKLEKKVAIKSLHKNLASDTTFRKRFSQEAKTHSKLDHPNIVKLLDYKEQKDGLFLIMEYVDGKQLDEHIKKVSGPIPEKELTNLFTQILDAIGYAHEEGLVHRDIKPSNIMIDKRGRIKVLDFGIAKMQEEEKGLTKTGMQIGTVSYMSPEQVNAEKVDKLTDIYSLGVTLFQMAVGQSPYSTTTNTFKIQQKIVMEPFPNPKDIYPSISDKLVAIIKKATQKDKKDRYQSCEEFKKDLNASSVKRSVIESPKVKKEIANKERSTSSKVLIRALIIGAVIFAGYMWSNDYFEQNRKDDYLSYYKSAKQYQDDELYQTAINYYDKCIKIHAEADSILFLIGEIYILQESWNKAELYFTKAINLNQNKADYFKERGYTRCRLKQYELSIADCSAAIKIDDNNDVSYYWRAYAYSALKDYQSAIDDFSKSLNINNNDKYAYSGRGFCYSRINKYQSAISDFNKAIRIAPDDDFAYFRRGNVHYKLGELTKAIKDYSQAITLDDTQKHYWRNRGIARYDAHYLNYCSDYKKACELGDKVSCSELNNVCK